MTWITIAKLIAEIGYPLAMKIWQNAKAGGDATQAQWDELEVMSSQRAIDRMRAQLIAAEIDPESEQGKAMLALAK